MTVIELDRRGDFDGVPVRLLEECERDFIAAGDRISNLLGPAKARKRKIVPPRIFFTCGQLRGRFCAQQIGDMTGKTVDNVRGLVCIAERKRQPIRISGYMFKRAK